MPLGDYLVSAHQRHRPDDYKAGEAKKKLVAIQDKTIKRSVEERVKVKKVIFLTIS